jgi:hypothetical protein
MLHPKIGHWPYLQTLDLAGKDASNKYSSELRTLLNLLCVRKLGVNCQPDNLKITFIFLH